jgi:hypothetical protein
MTKKHFVMLAEMIRSFNEGPNDTHHETCKYLGNDAWDCGHIDNSDDCDCHGCKGTPFTEYQIFALADFCQSQNAQFDRARFLAACGVK